MARTVTAVFRTAFAGVAVPLALIYVGVQIIYLGHRRPASPRIDALARQWARVFLFSTRTKATIEGREHIDPTRSYVFVANHLSAIDIPLDFVTVDPVGIRFLAKKELFRVPLLGTVMRNMGIVETDRQAGQMAHDDINRQIQHVVVGLGRSLMIYPEGTRSRDGTLRPFKKGAFRIAIDNQMPVIPISISGTYEVFPPGSKLVYGGPVTAIVHPSIEVAGMGHGDIDRLRDQAYTAISGGLGGAGDQAA